MNLEVPRDQNKITEKEKNIYLAPHNHLLYLPIKIALLNLSFSETCEQIIHRSGYMY